MKKMLFLMAGACLSLSAIAAEPSVLPDFLLTGVSANGEWAAGHDPMSGDVILYKISDESTQILPGQDGMRAFYMGLGNYLSNSGAAAGSVGDDVAGVWENGKITELPVGNEIQTSSARGITPDGSRICGIVSTSGMTTEEVIMETPVIWNRNEDGTWDKCIPLPYPEKDFTDRTPQYIFATAISADGKTIAGQVQDYSGRFTYPIVWKENDKGEWTYSLPNIDLINPDGVVFPEWPGDAPEYPVATDFMTPEEAEAYNIALEQYYTTWVNAPDPANYMTPEEFAAYQTAIADYTTAFDKWMTEFLDYSDLLDSLLDKAVLYVMNNVAISPNGRYYASTHSNNDPEMGLTEEYPVVLDLETGEAHLLKSDVPLNATYVDDQGAVLAYQTLMTWYMVRNAWISPSLGENFVTLSDYIQPRYPSVYTWMEENMRHDMESYDPETFDPVTLENVWQAGTPNASADMSTIVSFTQNSWDYTSSYYSYILPLGSFSGTADMKAPATFGLNVGKNGNIRINGQASHLDVFDLNGRRVFGIDNPSAVVATGLKTGFYIIKATGKDGNSVTVKAAF